VERPEWEDPRESDAAPLYPAAPIPLHERTWRHPSELAATSQFVAPPTPELHRGVLIAASLIGLACVIGLALVLLPEAPPSDPVLAAAGAERSAATTLTLATGRSEPGWAGIECLDALGGRVLVAAVAAGSPAEESGVEPGDEITAVDGSPVNDADGFRALMAAASNGKDLALTLVREGETHQMTVQVP
jgi:membrane-associated protease RseP (regulator of RpoE activity)